MNDDLIKLYRQYKDKLFGDCGTTGIESQVAATMVLAQMQLETREMISHRAILLSDNLDEINMQLKDIANEIAQK